MSDLLQLLKTLGASAELASRVAAALPQGQQLVEKVRRHHEGDLGASLDLAQHWHRDLIGLAGAVHPVAGRVAERLYRAVGDVREAIAGDVIEGEFYEVRPPPYERFLGRLFRQRWGGHIVIGPVGSGKTALAHKLAYRYSQESGYRCEFVNCYGEDLPWFAHTIGMHTLMARMDRLGRYLEAQVEPDEGEDAEEDDDRQMPSLPPTQRVIVIDEASLSMSTHAASKERKAAFQALAQCRHLRWHVVLIAQWTGQLPLGLFSQTVVWIKRPHGREIQTDRDNPAIRDLWTRAVEAFDDLRQSPWYRPPYDDPRAWAYVDAPTLNGAAGWTGLVPFTPSPAEPPPEPEEIEER